MSMTAQDVARVYLTGAMNDWTTPDYMTTDQRDTWSLTDDDGDGVYNGYFTLDKDKLDFKLFTSIAGWNSTDDYLGVQSDYAQILQAGVATSFKLESSILNSNIRPINFEGGDVELSFDSNNKILTITADNVSQIKNSVYLVGAFNGWTAPSDMSDDMLAEWSLVREEGTLNYVGSYAIPASQCEFKVFTEISGWDDSSAYVGTNYPYMELFQDEKVSLAVNSNSLGNIGVSNWMGGELNIIYNMAQEQMTLSSPDAPERSESDIYPPYIYLIGTPNGWSITESDFILEKLNDGVYAGSFFLGQDPIFRFYKKLGDWQTNSIGSQMPDSPVDAAFYYDATKDQNICVSSFVDNGKGSWQLLGGDPDKEVFIAIDYTSCTVSFTQYDVSALGNVVDDIIAMSMVNGVARFSSACDYAVYDINGRAVLVGNGDTADLSAFSKGIYVLRAAGRVVKIVR